MEELHRHHHHHHHHHHRRSSSIATITAIAFILLISTCTAIRPTPTHQQLVGERSERRSSGSSSSGAAAEAELELEEGMERRRLGGPGSSPPTCRYKCGRCTPCRPVHVPIQPGFSQPLEYYPEAWRCKCANKLFMP